MFSQYKGKRVDVIDIVNKLIDVVLDVHRFDIDCHLESFPKNIDYIDGFHGCVRGERVEGVKR